MDEQNWKDQMQIFNLMDENEKLKKKNQTLIRKNEHFKSTKAYKMWKKIAELKSTLPQEEIKNISDIKIAFIADEFTYNSFKWECDAFTVTPKNWKRKFREEKPDIFFCESAWRGYDDEGKEGVWKGRIVKRFNAKKDRRAPLLEIIEYCKIHSIPTVFWNKEDPPHYRTESYSFAETAKEFDYIFTTSESCIKHYKKDFNHPNVNTLMFAGQPKLFNPLKFNDEKIDKVVFAGTYYTNHPKRIELMDMIFDKILEQWGDMLIYDRKYYEDWANYPDRFLDYTHPPITFEQTAEVYKKMDWGLNFNIITDSNTMFARRVFELALCYVNILTNYSLGVDKIFGDNVFVFDDIDRLPDFNDSYDEKRLANLYNVLENHTYTNRLMQILDTIGIKYKLDKNDVTLIFKLNNLDDLEKIISKFESITYDNKVLKILVEDETIKFNAKKYPQIKKVYKNVKQIKKDIKTEFWMICDLNIENDFIAHAMLHYQYINKRISIKSDKNKFRLSIDEDFENRLINKVNVSYIDNDDLKVHTYSI